MRVLAPRGAAAKRQRIDQGRQGTFQVNVHGVLLCVNAVTTLKVGEKRKSLAIRTEFGCSPGHRVLIGCGKGNAFQARLSGPACSNMVRTRKEDRGEVWHALGSAWGGGVGA